MEKLLGSSNGSHGCQHLDPCFSGMTLHIDLLQDLTLHSTFQEVLHVLIRTLTLEFQGLKLGQEVIYMLAGSLKKMQELGPCPLPVVPGQEEPLNLHLECHPGWPHVIHHALIKANLCKMACTRPLQMQVNSHCFLLIGGGGMGSVDPDFDLGPPLMEFLQRPIIDLRGHDNFLQRKGAGSSWANVCLMHEELGKCCAEVLLILDELLDSCFPIHCLVGGGMGPGFLETREPKSVMAGIWWRGWWYVIWDCGNSGYLEV